MKKTFSVFPERLPQGVKGLLPPKQVGINYASQPATNEKPLVTE